MEILTLNTNEINQNGYTKNTLTRSKIGALYTFPILYTPDDCLSCEGYSLNIVDYKELYDVLGTQFNKSNDANGTFRIPDYNITKRFLQPGSDVGSIIVAGLPQHTHSGTTSSNGAHTHTAQSAGAHTHNYTTVNTSSTPRGDDRGGCYNSVYTASTTSAGEHTHTTTSNGAHTHTITTGEASDSTYGSSTTVQPPSQIVHICIKYK